MRYHDTMGARQSKPAGETTDSGRHGDRAVKRATEAAFRAVDGRNLKKLTKAMSVGAALGNYVRRASNGGGGGGGSNVQSRSMSLLEYTVDRNYLEGVSVMLKVSLSLPFPVLYHV